MSKIEITNWVILYLMFGLQLKHLLIDWCLQPPYEYLNKGKYGHWGGIRHSLKNAIGTVSVFASLLPVSLIFSKVIFIILIADFLIHYHVDWLKMNINKYMQYTPTNSENFWRLTGIDQFIHQITYIGLIIYFLNYFNLI